MWVKNIEKFAPYICKAILISNKNNIKSKMNSLSFALDIIFIGDFVALKQM